MAALPEKLKTETGALVKILFVVAEVLVILVVCRFLIVALGGWMFTGFFPLRGKLLVILVLFYMFNRKHIKKFWLRADKNGNCAGSAFLAPKLSVVFWIVILVLVCWHHQHVRQNYLKKIYHIFFSGSTVEKVRLIDGRYFAWMDWHADLTLSTEQHVFDSLIEGYEIIPRKNIIGNYFVNFPSNNSDVVFYYKDVPGEDKRCEEYLIAWDKKNNKAYLSGRNSFYIDVPAARVNIQKGAVIGHDMIEMKETTWTKLGERAFTDNIDVLIIGKAAARDIVKGEHIDYRMLKTNCETYYDDGKIKSQKSPDTHRNPYSGDTHRNPNY